MAEDMQKLSDLMTESEQEETVYEAVDGKNVAEESVAQSKVFTEEELESEKSKVQSAFERKAAQAKREAEVAEARAAQAKREAEVAEARAAQLETRHAALGTRLMEIESEKEREYESYLQNSDEGQKLLQIYRQLKDNREHQLAEREFIANQKYSAGEYGLKVSHAIRLAKEYGLNDYEQLLDAKTENDMKAKALELKVKRYEDEIKTLKTTPKSSTKSKEEKSDVETEIEDDNPVHVDSGSRVSGGPKRLFSLKEIEAMDAATYAKYEAQIVKQMGEGKVK